MGPGRRGWRWTPRGLATRLDRLLPGFPQAFTALLALGILPGALAAQGSLAGRVLADDGHPVAGAHVEVAGTRLGAWTSHHGRYLIVDIAPGQPTIRVRHRGLVVAEAEVRVAAGQRTRRDFSVGDIHAARRLLESGQVEMAAALNELSPSVYFPRRQGADLTSGVRPFQLRGLSPDHTLVLVNGRRRHATAVVHTSGGGAFPGSSGVDLNAIPIQAVARVQVRHDGGATRHGADAIAGTVDLRLRNTVSAPEFIASAGRHAPDEWADDGSRYDLSANWGIGIGRGGVLNLTGALSERERTNRAGADPRDQLLPGDADFVDDGIVIRKNHEVEQPNHAWGDGTSSNRMLFANLELPVADAPEAARLYAFGGYSRRREQHPGLYVRSLDDRNWPAIHPLGFLPSFDADTRDLFGVAGIRGGAEDGWRWDVSAEYGANRIEIDLANTLNPSLGPCLATPCAPGPDGMPGTADDPGLPNRTRFRAGALENGQLAANADLRRRLDLGLGGGDATVALGTSLRRDRYAIVAGEPGSFAHGFHLSQSGGIAASGSQPFPGFRPAEAGHWGRSNLAAYAEATAPLRPDVLASAAARYEHHGGVGGTMSGRLAVRVRASDHVILRTSASTGFRAPALSQTHYGHVAAGRRENADDPENPIAYEVGAFPLAAPEASAVGAVPLTMERARSVGAGFDVGPADNLRVTVDGYATDVHDAIILSNPLSSARVERLLADFDAESIRFFLNAVDLRAYGVDATVGWRRGLGDASWIELGAAAHWSQVRGRCPGDDISACVRENAILGDGTAEAYDAFDVYDLEEGRPDWRGVFGAGLTAGAWHLGLGANVYGSQEELRQLGPAGDPALVRLLEAKVVWDAHLSWDFGSRWRLTVGAENLFDAFPTRVDALGGILPYRSTSAMGFNGRYLYTRLRASAF